MAVRNIAQTLSDDVSDEQPIWLHGGSRDRVSRRDSAMQPLRTT